MARGCCSTNLETNEVKELSYCSRVLFLVPLGLVLRLREAVSGRVMLIASWVLICRRRVSVPGEERVGVSRCENYGGGVSSEQNGFHVEIKQKHRIAV